jgi:Phage integrase family.
MILSNSLAGTYGYMPALISYHTGMRLGEIIGPPWDAVNLDAATIEVMQSYSLKDEDGRPVIRQPKTKAGRRIVEVGPTLLKALADHRKAQLERRIAVGESWWHNDLNPVCIQDNGAPVSSRVIGHFFSRRAIIAKLTYACSYNKLKNDITFF